MNQHQYYLTKLAEECNELAQIVLKTQIFGQNEKLPGQPFTNLQWCHQEIDDIFATIEELNEKFNFGYVTNEEHKKSKKEKLKRYMEYSISLGTVDGETETTKHPMLE